jgi:hypothetical protein
MIVYLRTYGHIPTNMERLVYKEITKKMQFMAMLQQNRDGGKKVIVHR